MNEIPLSSDQNFEIRSMNFETNSNSLNSNATNKKWVFLIIELLMDIFFGTSIILNIRNSDFRFFSASGE
jgi:hypothetical protein